MRSPRFDLSPLAHPAWWVALLVMIVNDNLLKGGGIVPGWLTGKLSDFAFLIVAPVLAGALVPTIVRGRRLLALGSVTAVYAAADLSPAVSDAVVALAARVGLAWRLWPDVTDLVALAALPLAWWLLAPPAVPAPAAPVAVTGRRRRRPALEAAGVLVGAAACLATSAPVRYQRHPFLVNHGDRQVGVRVTWLLAGLDCSRGIPDPAAVAASLDPNDLGDGYAFSLAVEDVAALDAPPAGGDVPLVGLCSNRPATGSGNRQCTAAIVEIPGLATVLVVAPHTWDDGEPSRCAQRIGRSDNPGPEALRIHQENGQLLLVPGRNVGVAPVSLEDIAARPPTPEGCRAQRAEYQTLVAGAQTCTTDQDCRAARTLRLPGDTSCHVYVNNSVAPEALSTRVARWHTECAAADPTIGCPTARPAVCSEGRCSEICPGVALPPCQARCEDLSSPTTPGAACSFAWVCQNAAGDLCSCPTEPNPAPSPRGPSRTVTCSPLPIVDPACPLRCW